MIPTYIYRCLHTRRYTSALEDGANLANLTSAPLLRLSNLRSCLLRNLQLLLYCAAPLHRYRESPVGKVVLHCKIYSSSVDVGNHNSPCACDFCHGCYQETHSASAKDEHGRACLELRAFRGLNGYTEGLEQRTQVERHIAGQPRQISTSRSVWLRATHL
jgi:hypothetical protein